MNITLEHKREKWIASIVTLLSFLALTKGEFFLFYIALGQAHFALTYFYQYRAGKMDTFYIIKFIAAFVLFFGTYSVYPNFGVLSTFASLWFAAHMISDELFLLKSPPSLSRTLMAVSVFILYAYLVLVGHHYLPRQNHDVMYPVVLGGVGLCLTAAYFARAYLKEMFGGLELYFLLLALFFMGLLEQGIFTQYGILVIYHYMSWYMNLYHKYRSDAPKLRHYLKSVVVANIVCCTLFLLYKLQPQEFGVMGYFFDVKYFLLWTLMHLTMTLRPFNPAHLMLVRAPSSPSNGGGKKSMIEVLRLRTDWNVAFRERR